MSAKSRPKGIPYISVFYLGVSAILLIVAILCFAPSATYSGQSIAYEIWRNSIITIPRIGDNIDRWFSDLFVPYIIGWGVVSIILASFVALAAVMLFQMKIWGRNLTMLIALPLIGILIGLLILWYLFKDDVKLAFTAGASPVKKHNAK